MMRAFTTFPGRLVISFILGASLPTSAPAAEDQPAVPSEVLAAEAERIARIEQASAATIAVFGPDAAGGGSGVIISPDGFALTNYHVTNPCGDYMRCGMSNGELYDAVIVGLDPGGDVALIKLFGRDDFPTAVMGDSDQLRAGDSCFVAGNPFVLATNFEPTVTYGIISGVHRYQPPAGTLLEYADCIQTDAAINPGNSGGPLFNAEGELVGINGRCSFEKRGRVNVGVGYAISINQIKKFLGNLHSGRIVDHATLGFTVSDQDGRVLVSNILRSSDAFRRGIRYEDEIISLDGVTVDSANALKNQLGTYPKGWRIPVTYRRDQIDQTVQVRLAGVHPAEKLFELLEAKPPSRPHDHPPGEETAKGPEMPKVISEHFEKRWGFANYHYNRAHLERVRLAVRSTFPGAVEAGEWKLQGTMKREGPYRVAISPETVLSVLPSGSWNIADQPEFSSADLVPSGSGGLLLALQMWQRLVRSTSDDPALSYGELIYEGQAPLQGVLHDTVLGVHKNLETRYFFDVANSRLAALEMFPDTGVDPCELTFLYENAESSTPIGFTADFGDQRVGDFEIEEFRID